VCGAPLEIPLAGAVCARCWSQINRLAEPLCRVCGDALSTWRIDGVNHLCTRCARRRRLITIGRAVGPYEGTLRDVLHVLKYDKRRSVARPLGRLMAVAGISVLDGADFLVPVPLHFSRHYRRGFNQASELAKHVGVPVVNVLRRRRPTATQTDLPETERHRNVRDAFAVRRGASGMVKNAVLVIIDDVSTTGATLDASAAVLLSAGAKEVRALTAARAVSRLL
jgi:ComF family protein